MKLAHALVFLLSQFFTLLFNRVGKIAGQVEQVLIKFVEIRIVGHVLVAGEKLCASQIAIFLHRALGRGRYEGKREKGKRARACSFLYFLAAIFL